MCSLRFENNFLTIEGVRFASISKKTPLSKLSFAFLLLALPLLMLSIFLRRFFLSWAKKIFNSVELLRTLVSVNNDFLKFLIFEVLKKLLKILLPHAYAPAFMRMLSIRIRNWCASWAYAQGTGAHAEHTRQELMRLLNICISFLIFQWPFIIEVPTNHAEHVRKELVRMLNIHVRKWCACWAYASVPYGYAQHARQKLNAA
jgi:hypothetical protein